MKPGLPMKLVSVLIALLLIAPTLIICATAFTDGSSVTFPPQGFSLRWIEEVLGDRRWMTALLNSLVVGLLAGVIASVSGAALALGASRTRGLLAQVFTAASLLPMIVPLVVGAIGFYLVYVRVGLTGNAWGLAIAHATLGLPYVFVNVLARLRGLDPRMEEAARVHGASQLRATLTVTMPLIMPAALVGGVLAFVSSWDEVIVANFLSDARFQTLPVLMYGQLRSGVEPSVSAVALIVTAISFLLMSGAAVVGSVRRRLMKVKTS